MIRPIQLLRMIAVTSSMAILSPAFAADKPTTKPASATAPTKPVKKTGTPAELTKAIAELNKEFSTFAAKPDSSSLRTTSDYFKSLPQDVTVDDLIAVMEKGMSGSAPQVAYVKWQLLSGCPSKVEGAQAVKLFSLYRNAPTPLQVFASDPKTRQQLDRMIVGMKDGQETAVNDSVGKMSAQTDAVNAPILNYRDALYNRLPTNADVLIARLQDAVVRVQAGCDLKSLLSDMESEVRSWLAVGANPQQASAVLSAVKEAKKIKGPDVYISAYWDEKLTPKAMTWKKRGSAIGAGSEKIETSLKEYLNNPGGGLKFK